MKRVLPGFTRGRHGGKGPPGRPSRPGSAGFDTSGTKRAFELADSTRLAPTVLLKGRKPARMGADGSRCCAHRMRPPAKGVEFSFLEPLAVSFRIHEGSRRV